VSPSTTLLVQFRLPTSTGFVAEYADHLTERGLELQTDASPISGTPIELRLTHPDGSSVIERTGHVGRTTGERIEVVFTPCDPETAERYRALLEALSTRDIQTEDLIYAPGRTE
jgi:hypothetical protein